VSKKDSVGRTLVVAFVVCLVCAVVVSTAAVVLKPIQQINNERNRQENILAAAGILQTDVPLEEQFSRVQTRVVDLRTGKYTDAVDAATYDNLSAAKSTNPDLSVGFDDLPIDDRAKIGRRENYAVVYLVEDAGELSKIILPIRGYGLWSTLYGFIALEADASTVAGIGFYDQKETPGLGGEVDNPDWKAIWHGKEIYDNGEVALRVIKGAVDPEAADAEHRVDGLSGATLTTRGVDNLVRFWLGEYGYKPFLENLKMGEA
jgi:Na+-transporting NADH:ubiquinone oxidoreductase subunit C